MDVVSYLLGKNAGGGGGGDSEYLNTEITEKTSSANKFQLLKKPYDVYVDDSVTELAYAFNYMSYQYILPNIHSKNVQYIQSMFAACNLLKRIDLSGMYGEIKACQMCFQSCKNLEYIDIRNMTFDANVNAANFLGGSSSNGPASNCEIIVKSNTEKQFLLSLRADLTNIKTVAEL